jgi:uncharacterized membrane protein YeiH
MAASDHVTTIEVPLVINLAAAGAGGLLGTLRAGQKEKLDLVGVLFVAFAVGFGGGVIRDLLLGSLPPASFQSPWYIAVVGLAAMAGSLFLWTLHRISGLLFVADAFTIGLFAVVGTNKAILYHLGFLPAVLIGILASVGGSILADILMGETPSTLVAGPPNAVAAAVGAMTYYGCYVTGGLGNLDSTLCAVAVTFSLRFLGIRFGVSIPKPLRCRSLPDSLKRGQGREIGPTECNVPLEK